MLTDGRTIHLQAFANVEHSKILAASVGLLDLDAGHKHPMPGGETGSTAIDGDVITFTIGPDAAQLVNNADDTARTVGDGKPVKWIETSTYISQELSRLSLRIGRDGRYHEFAKPASTHNVSQIRFSRHGVVGTGSRFVGFFHQHGPDDALAFSGHVELNALDGAVNGKGLTSSRESTSIISDDGKVALSYGFSGQAIGRADQIYAYVTPAYSDWLGSMIDADARWRDLPFSRLVLAAAHDCGMFVYPLNQGLLELIQSGTLGDALGHHVAMTVGLPVVHSLLRVLEAVKLSPSRSVLGIANTQRDDTSTLLRLGIRFFDVRANPFRS